MTNKENFEKSKIKVEQKTKLIIKLCNKLDIDSNKLLNDFYALDYKGNYLPSKVAKELVSHFIAYRPNRDENGYWINDAYEFNGKIDQLGDNLCKLFDQERVTKNWENKVKEEENRNNAPKIEVIWNFLCEWEQKALTWYRENSKHYLELRENESSEFEKYKQTEAYTKLLNIMQELYKYSSRVEYYTRQDFIKHYYSDIDGFTKQITNTYRKTIDEELLTKTIAKEKLNKYFDLVSRVTSLIGIITDASHLSIGNQNGELNGIIEGENGRCRVETISAGGYNIQCFHYRVLIHKI